MKDVPYPQPRSSIVFSIYSFYYISHYTIIQFTSFYFVSFFIPTTLKK